MQKKKCTKIFKFDHEFERGAWLIGKKGQT